MLETKSTSAPGVCIRIISLSVNMETMETNLKTEMYKTRSWSSGSRKMFIVFFAFLYWILSMRSNYSIKTSSCCLLRLFLLSACCNIFWRHILLPARLPLLHSHRPIPTKAAECLSCPAVTYSDGAAVRLVVTVSRLSPRRTRRGKQIISL